MDAADHYRRVLTEQAEDAGAEIIAVGLDIYEVLATLFTESETTQHVSSPGLAVGRYLVVLDDRLPGWCSEPRDSPADTEDM